MTRHLHKCTKGGEKSKSIQNRKFQFSMNISWKQKQPKEYQNHLKKF